MLPNLCAIIFYWCIAVAVVFVRCDDLITKKYTPDKNRIIKRLHESTHAKLFLYGCEGGPYIDLKENDTTVSKFFELKKSKEYVFAIFTLDEFSLILSNSNATNNTEKEEETDEVVLFNISECYLQTGNGFYCDYNRCAPGRCRMKFLES